MVFICHKKKNKKYIVDLLLKFHMHTCKLVGLPIASHTCIVLEDDNLLSNQSEYRSTVGALHYLMMTHPNNAYAVNIISQFMYSP